jgi:hypothetical protein
VHSASPAGLVAIHRDSVGLVGFRKCFSSKGLVVAAGGGTRVATLEQYNAGAWMAGTPSRASGNEFGAAALFEVDYGG